MKPLLFWLVPVVVVFAVLGAEAVATRGTTRVFVVVDSSFAMAEVWSEVPDELDRIDDRDHAEFALATEKGLVHSWQDELRLGSLPAFAPCTFGGIEGHREAGEADDLVLVTTSTSCATSALVDWDIVLIDAG